MVWREAYSTRVLDEPEFVVPTLRAFADDEPVAIPDGAWVWLAGPDVDVQLRLGVWLRLLDSMPQPPVRLISTWSGRPAPKSRAVWEAVVPRSHHPLWTWAEGNPFEQDMPLVAAAMRGSRPELVLVGAPTEEAWDAFQDALVRAAAPGP